MHNSFSVLVGGLLAFGFASNVLALPKVNINGHLPRGVAANGHHEIAERGLFTPKASTTAKPTSTTRAGGLFTPASPNPTPTPTPTQRPSTCAPFIQNAPSTIYGTGTLPKPTSFVYRDWQQLKVSGSNQVYRPVGPNIYWLGLDENVGIAYPSKQRIREAMAMVVAMGGNTIRAHTLGISVGCQLCVWPSLYNTNNNAFDSIDYAIFAAREYGLRLIIPFGDNFDYYHGGKYTFLRWRGVSTDNYGEQFYYNQQVINDFKAYINVIMTHVNRYTGVALKDDPTILAWETGNELGGYMGKQPTFPPLSFTNSIAGYIKSIDNRHLLLDGSMGFWNYEKGNVNDDPNSSGYNTSPSLNSGYIDLMADHTYPLMNWHINPEKQLARDHGKGFIIGEYDWTGNNGGDSLDSFISNIESTNYMGDFLWSLFGHDDQCCNFVQHNDGFSLYYPNGNDGGKQQRILQIVQHWHRMTGRNPPNSLPGVACPQASF